MDNIHNKKNSLIELVGFSDGRKDNHHHIPRTVLAVNNEENSKHVVHDTSSLVIDDSARHYTAANNTTSLSTQQQQQSNLHFQDQASQEQQQHEDNNIYQKKHSVTQFISAINRHSAVEDLAPVWALEESRTSDEGDKDGSGKTRETWDKKVDFLLSMIGFAVDLANVWRFPYLCYKNGGGAFLIPYFTMLVFGAMPMFFMELVLGQCHKSGSIAVWKIVPLFKGIGICQCMIAIFVAFYYNVIIAWSLYYLISSLTTSLPWTTCNNYWNTMQCSTTAGVSVSNTSLVDYNSSDILGLSRLFNISVDAPMPKSYMTPTEEFFERKVLGLHLSNGLENIGSPRVELVLCLLVVFFIIYFSVWKGVKTSGKVVWVTATMPYVVLTVLFIRGLMLPGSGQGILYYITPTLERLGDPHVWIDAAVQIFYSSGAGFGVHIAFASYNKLRHNCYRDCLITVFVNSFTSLYSGFVIFAYLGYMAASQSKDIASVAAEGPGLVFVVYPEAIATLPGSIFWSILFFVMLITLGLDSAMGGLEALLTGISDEFRHVMSKFKYSRELLTMFVVLAAFISSLPNVTNGGMYLVTMWDTFAAGTSILTGVFAEVIAVAWIYGMEQFCQDINYILKFKPNFYWRFCWKIVSPALLLVMIVSSIASYKPLEYSSYTLETYTYPVWANIMGWMIAASSISCIPLTAIYQLLSTEGTFKQRLALNISPYWEHESIKTDGRVKRFQKSHWLW